MRQLEADFVIVGSGLAGLSAALTLAPRKVVLITKTAGIEGGSSLHAQGGIAAAIGAGDRPSAHAADTLAAGSGLCDPVAVARLTEAGPQAIATLRDLGVRFDTDAAGNLMLGREGAHGCARVAHADGDRTGRAVVLALAARVRATPSITVMAETMVTDLLVSDGRIAGLALNRKDGGPAAIRCAKVMLATGGLGGLWQHTTNPPEATGDGLALAVRAGAALVDLEFMQFHPTALLVEGREPLPLLTEALRGAGARLLKADALTPLLAGVHPQGDLAPRDVVARAIHAEMAAHGRVYLDLRPALEAKGAAAFPQAIETCCEAGLDPFAVPVPVTPAAHYHMGGILVDGEGRATIPGLYACGEVSGTGVHGANRLASNSLLEACVAGRRTAQTMALDRRPAGRTLPHALLAAGIEPAQAAPLRARLRQTMMEDVGLLRDAEGLRRALERLDGYGAALAAAEQKAPQETYKAVRAAVELRNLATIGRLVALLALSRTESRGAHTRLDHPAAAESWLRRQTVTVDGAGARLDTIGLAAAGRLAAE
ncbi:L-aspartate oxidase [Zavarzinia compransoris]|uniref:L-aspartate oxidase n=1 Tax=Zavarzinia compransoris TaxID=1264899 RepID=A0A317EEF8_9PROT|nr:L-aspartate oxidase [Zavarzinia compransoris]PWR23743.1 L-aspartate oxidase [Zavarzinia compransoris]TDP47969.1 L-aspartate oxidase [Zavarzinia compransoris]